MKNLNIFSSVTEYENTKSGGVLNVPNVSFVDEDNSVRYLLENIPTHNGYEYVDLGLSVKWATCNIGATSPEQVGLYFAWGETTGYTAEQVTSKVRLFNEDVYNAGSAASISTDLTLEQDAARANLGGNWHMPTKYEYQELLNNCNVVWTDDYNGTGVKGRVFTSRINGNSVFFPATGRCEYGSVNFVGRFGSYRSTSWYSDSVALILLFDSGSQKVGTGSRYFGYPVRGVCE